MPPPPCTGAGYGRGGGGGGGSQGYNYGGTAAQQYSSGQYGYSGGYTSSQCKLEHSRMFHEIYSSFYARGTFLYWKFFGMGRMVLECTMLKCSPPPPPDPAQGYASAGGYSSAYGAGYPAQSGGGYQYSSQPQTDQRSSDYTSEPHTLSHTHTLTPPLPPPHQLPRLDTTARPEPREYILISAHLASPINARPHQ